jgi:hypothetical protein
MIASNITLSLNRHNHHAEHADARFEGMHATSTSPADSWKSLGQAPSCYSEPRVGGALCSLVLALRIYVHILMQQQALQLTQIFIFNADARLLLANSLPDKLQGERSGLQAAE